MSDHSEIARRIAEITDRVAPSTEACTADFNGIALRIRPGVFNPAKGRSARRMARAIDLVPPRAGDRVLEIGTGSGILSILAHRHAGRHVTALDIMPAAIACARDNFAVHKVPAAVAVSDMFAAVTADRAFDYILFNAPTAHPSVRPDNRGLVTLWDPDGTLKKRFVEGLDAHLAETPHARALMMYSVYRDYNSLAQIDFSRFETSRLLVETDDLSETGVMMLTRRQPQP